MSRLRVVWLAACLLATLLLSRPALAMPRVTIIVRKINAPALEQFETQLRAELLAMGFEVLTLPEAPPTIDPETLEKIAEQTQAVAAIIIEQPEGSVTARLWVTERVTGKTLFRKVRPEKLSPDAPSIFALRSVELLRASLLELNEPHPPRGTVEAPPNVRALVAPRASAQKPPPPAPKPLPSPPATRPAQPLPPVASAAQPPPATGRLPRPRWGASAGASAIVAPGGIPWSTALQVGLAWHPLPRWATELRFAGPFSAQVSQGSSLASTDQEMFFLRLRHSFLSEELLFSPYATLGVGVHRLGTTGKAMPPYHGVSNSAWTALGMAGAGVRLRVARNLGIDLEVNALATASRQKILFDESTTASTGRPIVMATLAAEVLW